MTWKQKLPRYMEKPRFREEQHMNAGQITRKRLKMIQFLFWKRNHAKSGGQVRKYERKINGWLTMNPSFNYVCIGLCNRFPRPKNVDMK